MGSDHRPAQPAPRDDELFEALRQGSTSAFTALARRYHPSMVALSRAYAADEAVADDLVRDAWGIALPGLDMFEWRCTLRAWVTSILVGIGRRHAMAAPPPQPLPPPPPGNSMGRPWDWDDLPWGARWSGEAWGCARAAVAALPIAEREVLVLAAIAGWDRREACDALGLTEARHAILTEAAHGGVHDVLVTWLGEDPSAVPDDLRTCRRGPVERVLADLGPQGGAPAPALDQVFSSWRAARRRARRRVLLRRVRPR